MGDFTTQRIAGYLNLSGTYQTGAVLLTIGRRAGMDGKELFDALSRGSADSFVLRNHGMKAVLPDTFPERAFSTEYALKDLSYALDLASQAGLAPKGAEVARTYLTQAAEQGFGKLYWPVVNRIISKSVT